MWNVAHFDSNGCIISYNFTLFYWCKSLILFFSHVSLNKLPYKWIFNFVIVHEIILDYLVQQTACISNAVIVRRTLLNVCMTFMYIYNDIQLHVWHTSYSFLDHQQVYHHIRLKEFKLYIHANGFFGGYACVLFVEDCCLHVWKPIHFLLSFNSLLFTLWSHTSAIHYVYALCYGSVSNLITDKWHLILLCTLLDF